jgi:hypothetical protein
MTSIVVPSLLSLPREIRDNIIDYVVAFQRDPPTAGDDNFSGEEQRTQFEDTYWKDYGNLIYFESSPTAFQPAFGGLLLACQQLRAEALERASKVDIPMVLDLLVINEEKIWVTWLSLPANTGHMIEKLDIKYRYQYDGQEQTEETPKTYTWIIRFGTQLRSLLYRILAVGNAGPLPDANRRQVWTEARYKFNDTIRFEHEYLPHYSIRKLIFHYPYIANAADASLNTAYRNEVKEMVVEMALHNALYDGRKHPGWKTARERIGGISSFCGDKLEWQEYSDLNEVYLQYVGQHQYWAQPIGAILNVRKENGL